MVDQRERPAPARPLLSTAAVALLLALAVLVSPAIGEWNLDPPEFEPVPVEIPEETPQEEPATDLGEEDAEPEVEFESAPVSPIWSQILVAIVITAAVAITLMLAMWRQRSRRHRMPDHERSDLLVSTDHDPKDHIPHLAKAADRARADLVAGADTTDAIIQAWLALEEAAARSGVARRPAQTPTELTVAVLQGTDADPHATHGLLELYHRARFASAPMTTADHDRAIAHVEALAASWESVER